MSGKSNSRRASGFRFSLRKASAVSVAVAATVLAVTAARGGEGTADEVLVVKSARLHVGDGRSVAPGIVVIRGGKIEAAGPEVEIPSGCRVIEVADGSITPGLIDANAMIGPGLGIDRGSQQAGPSQLAARLFGLPSGAETAVCCGKACPNAATHRGNEPCIYCGYPAGEFASGCAHAEHAVEEVPSASAVNPRHSVAERFSEVVPYTDVIDSIDLTSPDFESLVRSGVTTVYVSPDPASVVTARGAIVRTAGPIDQRVIRDRDSVMATLGRDAIWRGSGNNLPRGQRVSFDTRRPTTRMGVMWVLRKALYDTMAQSRGQAIHGADMPPQPAIPVLKEILDGRIPLRVQARELNDIVAAIRVAGEFGLPFLLVEAIEAYRCIDEIKAAKVPVVFGPIFVSPQGFRAWSGEADKPRLITAKLLADAGIPFALTANEGRDECGLDRQAMYAIKYGLTPEQALTAVTKTPADLLGIGDRAGTVEPGKQADLVVWNGEPFAATSAPVMVMSGGQVVYERK